MPVTRRLLKIISQRRHLSNLSLVEDLRSRGFVAQVTSEKISAHLERAPQTVYLGIDPSAQSLHVGNLLGLLCLLHFRNRGHQVISLIGGATGRVGDPGGRKTERHLLQEDTVDSNVSSITSQIRLFFERASSYISKRAIFPHHSAKLPIVLNNLDWFQGITMLDFLRDVGKHAKVNVMITKDSVKNRLASEQGISFTEFSYQLLQAYDFYILNQRHGCCIQIGGSDQWGNIVAGIELIKRRKSMPEGEPDAAFGMTIPLLTTPTGEKLGKSEGNAVWLDGRLTSVFDFYQFFMKVQDKEVETYLKTFTLLPLDAVRSVMDEHMRAPQKRLAQQALATEVTELIHGETGVTRAKAATSALFGVDLASIRATDVIAALGDDPRLVSAKRGDVLGVPLTRLLSHFKQAKSRSEARQLLKSGGLYLNGQRVTDLERILDAADLIDGCLAVLRAGKDSHLVIAVGVAPAGP